MVGLITLGLCIVISVAIVSHKGINIKYDKTFTIDDKRTHSNLSAEDLKHIEERLNKQHIVQNNDDTANSIGPLDSVIAEIQDLFGPDKEQDQ